MEAVIIAVISIYDICNRSRMLYSAHSASYCSVMLSNIDNASGLYVVTTLLVVSVIVSVICVC